MGDRPINRNPAARMVAMASVPDVAFAMFSRKTAPAETKRDESMRAGSVSYRRFAGSNVASEVGGRNTKA